MKIKSILLYSSLTAVNFVVNFLIFNYSFNQQATPFLHEEQRVESGLLMLKTTLPAYLISSVVVTIAFYFLAKHLQRSS